MANGTDTILKEADILDAQTAITTYKTECDSCYEQLKSTIDSLTVSGSNFNGDSSDGYNEFFTAITPALTTNLEALTQNLTQMLDGIREMLLDTVDPGLGNANRQASSPPTAPIE